MSDPLQQRRSLIRRFDEDENGMPLLKISNLRDVRERLVIFRLIERHLANGKEAQTVAAATSLYLGVLLDYSRLGTTGQTSQLVTTTQGTFIVSVIDATTVGTQAITERMTGLQRLLMPIVRDHKRKMKKEGQS